MNNKLQAIITDLDGTLLSHQDEISTADLATIKLLKSKGVLVFIATGRSPSMCAHYAMEIGTDLPAITSNGGQIYDFEQKRPLYTKTIEAEYVDEVWSYMRTQATHNFYATENHDYYCKSDNNVHYISALSERFPFLNRLATIVDDDFDPRNTSVVKLLTPYCTQDIYEKFLQLDCVKQNKVEYTYSGGLYMDVTAKNVHKGSTMQELARRYGFSLENTLAMGDNDNDIAMLKMAGIPVVPASSSEKIKSLATFVTAENSNNPLTTAVRHLYPELLQ